MSNDNEADEIDTMPSSGWAKIKALMPSISLTGVNNYIERNNIAVSYGPMVVLTYGAMWVYYDGSDDRMAPEINRYTIDEADLILNYLYCGFTITLASGFFFFIFYLSFFFGSSLSWDFWSKLDKVHKRTTIVFGVAVIFGITCFLIPAAIIFDKIKNGASDESRGFGPELFLMIRLSLFFYVSHYCYVRSVLQPQYFPGWLSVVWIYVHCLFQLNQMITRSNFDDRFLVSFLVLRVLMSIPNIYLTSIFIFDMFKKWQRIKESELQLEQNERIEREERKELKQLQFLNKEYGISRNLMAKKDYRNKNNVATSTNINTNSYNDNKEDSMQRNQNQGHHNHNHNATSNLCKNRERFAYEENVCLFACGVIGPIFFVANYMAVLSSTFRRPESLEWIQYSICFQVVFLFAWQRLNSFALTILCYDLEKKLIREQYASEAREKLLLQILPPGIIKKLLSNTSETAISNSNSSSSSSRRRRSRETIQELIDLDAEANMPGRGSNAGNENGSDDTFISFSDARAVAELKGKAIGRCLQSIKPIVTPEGITYRIPTKKIERALFSQKP